MHPGITYKGHWETHIKALLIIGWAQGLCTLRGAERWHSAGVATARRALSFEHAGWACICLGGCHGPACKAGWRVCLGCDFPASVTCDRHKSESATAVTSWVGHNCGHKHMCVVLQGLEITYVGCYPVNKKHAFRFYSGCLLTLSQVRF
jgi:hypothetical protein